MPRVTRATVDDRDLRLPHLALLVAAALVIGGSLAGCNTIQGAGEDVSAAGDAVSDTAEDVAD